MVTNRQANKSYDWSINQSCGIVIQPVWSYRYSVPIRRLMLSSWYLISSGAVLSLAQQRNMSSTPTSGMRIRPRRPSMRFKDRVSALYRFSLTRYCCCWRAASTPAEGGGEGMTGGMGGQGEKSDEHHSSAIALTKRIHHWYKQMNNSYRPLQSSSLNYRTISSGELDEHLQFAVRRHQQHTHVRLVREVSQPLFQLLLRQ